MRPTRIGKGAKAQDSLRPVQVKITSKGPVDIPLEGGSNKSGRQKKKILPTIQSLLLNDVHRIRSFPLAWFRVRLFSSFQWSAAVGRWLYFEHSMQSEFFHLLFVFPDRRKSDAVEGALFILKETREFDLEYISLYRITGFIEWTIG